MDISKLFDINYLFQSFNTRGFSWPFLILLLVIFIGSIMVALLSAQKLNSESGSIKGFWYKLQIWGWTTGLVGLLLVVFREVKAIYLGSRFWMLLWLVVAFIWLIIIIRYKKFVIPAKEKAKQGEEEFTRWLPKKK